MAFGTDQRLGFSRTLGDSGRQPAGQSSFSRGISVVPDRLRGVFIKSAGEPRLGVSFDQQDGSAVGGWTEYGVIGAYARTARHAVKCAEWCRTQHVAWRSSPRTGRHSTSVSRACWTGPPPSRSPRAATGQNRSARLSRRSPSGGAACGFWIRLPDTHRLARGILIAANHFGVWGVWVSGTTDEATHHAGRAGPAADRHSITRASWPTRSELSGGPASVARYPPG
jgi:hypothetical protein